MKNKTSIILVIIFIIFCFTANSKTNITGGVITTQNDIKNLDSSSDVFFTSYKIKPPQKIEISKEHLKKNITFKDAVHLERRIGIGAPVERVQRYIGMTRKEAIDLIIDELINSPDNFNLPSWVENTTPINFMEGGFRGLLRPQYQIVIDNQKNSLTASWYSQLLMSDNPQFERLVLFWHNHFVVGFDDAYERPHAYARHILNLRKNANGNLREFLKNILFDPGMISYLNNDENFIDNFNENLGREFLELFTLGESNYSENDVKNLSKLLAGHSINPVSLDYEFLQSASTSKSWIILGKKIKNLDEVLDLVINHPKFSELIIEKFYKEYVSLDDLSETNLSYLKYNFFKNNFEVSNLLRSLLELPEFWDKENRLTLVKSPVDLFIGTTRTFGSSGKVGGEVLNLPYYMAQVGQSLIDPPNVAGWQGGLRWLDGNSIEKRNQAMSNWYSESICCLSKPIKFKNYNSRVIETPKLGDRKKKLIEKYENNLLMKFKQSHEDQLVVETMLINNVSKDFEKNKNSSIKISLYNMKLGDRYWDGFQFRIGVSKKFQGNYMRIESNQCFPECLDSFSKSWPGRKGTYIVKFSYPDGKDKRYYSALSERDKLLVNRLYELTSYILMETSLSAAFNKDEKNKENWFNWLREQHKIHKKKLINNNPNKERVILINKSLQDIIRMFSVLSMKSATDKLINDSSNNIFTVNIKNSARHNVKNSLRIDKLLVSDLELPSLRLKEILLHEAYQLK